MQCNAMQLAGLAGEPIGERAYGLREMLDGSPIRPCVSLGDALGLIVAGLLLSMALLGA